MNKLITGFIKFIIFIFLLVGIALVYNSKTFKHVVKQAVTPEVAQEESLTDKQLLLKNYLVKFQKPERIEVLGLSQRYKSDIDEIKKMKVAQDKKSEFYITIKLFTDETDKSAPLVAQIQFIDLKSGNLMKEESINLN